MSSSDHSLLAIRPWNRNILRHPLTASARTCYRGDTVRRRRMAANLKPAHAAAAQDLFTAPLATTDPEIAEAIRLGTRPPARRDRADRVGEHRQPRGARGAGLGAHQQVRRRPAGPALLRRLPVRRHRRNIGDSARYQAFRMSIRKRAAAFGRLRQRGRLHGPDGAGRHLHGPQPRGRRASDPRLARQHVGQVVQGRALRRHARHPHDRHGRGAQARASSTGRR